MKRLFRKAAVEIGFPCIVKPVMSSSGKGTKCYFVQRQDLTSAWTYSQEGKSRARGVIVEKMIPFDFEITLPTIRAIDGIHFAKPLVIGQKKAIIVAAATTKMESDMCPCQSTTYRQ